MTCAMPACSEARRSRNWGCKEAGRCSSALPTVTARYSYLGAMEAYSASHTYRGVPPGVKTSIWWPIRS